MVFVSSVVRVLIGVHAPMRVMFVMPEDLMEKNAEAMLLRVIQAVIERLGCIRDFFQFGAAGREVFRAEPEPLDQVAFLMMLFRLLPPFDRAGGSILGDAREAPFRAQANSFPALASTSIPPSTRRCAHR